MTTLARKLGRLDAQHRFGLSLCVAIAAGLLLREASTPLLTMAVWLAYALTNLALCWVAFFQVHPRELPALSKLADSSRRLIFVIVLVAAIASMGAVLALLTTLGGLSNAGRYVHITFSVLSIVSSWALVHTIFTLRYAHLYYGDSRAGSTPHGLEFPHEKAPDYLDFAYFSFVIGMTSQTSDVNICDREIRRVALVHGLLAFVYNVIIVSMTINVVSGLAGK